MSNQNNFENSTNFTKFVDQYGNVYIGQIKNGKKNGYGTLKVPNDCTYRGYFNDDKYEGYGTIECNNGCRYTGEFKNGKKNGYGTLKVPKRYTYHGYFNDDKYEGYGTIEYNDGCKYIGEFKNDKANGYGILYRSDGSECSGIFCDYQLDKPIKSTNFTKVVDQYNNVYIGQIKNGKKNGYGTLKVPNYCTYHGYFNDDKYEGHGAIEYNDGWEHVGKFKNGKAEGYGIVYHSDGREYSGNFCNHQLEGDGYFICSSKDRFRCNWQQYKVVDYKKIKKINNDNTEEIALHYVKDYAEKDRSTFETAKRKTNKNFINLNNNERYTQIKPSIKHIKIRYHEHGDWQRNLIKDIATKQNFPDATDKKSYYISSMACHGGFYGANDKQSFFNIIKDKISNEKDCIGFFSHAKQAYKVLYRKTIDKNGNFGARRVPVNNDSNTIIHANDEKFNKDDYFDYYCILNEKNESDKTEQHIYKIPSQLCYWREDLIDNGQFMEAFKALKEHGTYSFKTKALVDEGKETLIEKEQYDIKINGKIQEVEIVEGKDQTLTIKNISSDKAKNGIPVSLDSKKQK